MMKLFSLPIAKLEYDEESLNAISMDMVEFRIVTPGSFKLAYGFVSYLATVRDGLISFQDPAGLSMRVQNFDSDHLYKTCQDEGYQLFCTWKTEDDKFGICIDPSNPFIIYGNSTKGDHLKLAMFLLTTLQSFFTALARDCFIEIYESGYDARKIEDPILLYYASGFIEMLRTEEDRNMLLGMIGSRNYSDKFQDDSFIEESARRIEAMAKELEEQ